MKNIFGRNVSNKVVAPFGTPECGKFLRENFMNTVNEAVALADELDESLYRYDEIVDSISKLKFEKDVIEHTIMYLMKEYETAYVKNRKITWKKSSRCSIDTKALKENEPEIYERYCKVTNSRLFKIK